MVIEHTMDMLNSVSTDRCLQARKRKMNESLKLIAYFHVFSLNLCKEYLNVATFKAPFLLQIKN